MSIKKACDNCVFGEASGDPGKVYCDCPQSENFEADMLPTACCVCYEAG